MSTNEQKEKNISEFEIDDLIKSTCKKIQEWYNGEPSSISLKFLSIELIEDIAGAAFSHLGLNYNSTLNLDEETRRKLEIEREKMGIPNKQLSELSEEDLRRELERRLKSK